ncbi:hypothetical protein N2152v2_001357 [Parachlorella kessleri]
MLPAEGGEKPDLVDKVLGLDFLPRRERDRKQRQEIIGAYERFQGDTGSTEVQVALLTQKIRDLAEHMRQHKKDYASRRGLEAQLVQRRKLLTYLRRSKFDVYAALISRLGLKDSYAPQDRYTSRYKAADRR